MHRERVQKQMNYCQHASFVQWVISGWGLINQSFLCPDGAGLVLPEHVSDETDNQSYTAFASLLKDYCLFETLFSVPGLIAL